MYRGLNTRERVFVWNVCIVLDFGPCFTKCTLWIFFSIVLLNGRLVSVFFTKFKEVSSEAGNLRFLLEAPVICWVQKGVRFVWDFRGRAPYWSFPLNGYSETPKAGKDFGVSWTPEIECKADTFVNRSFVPGPWFLVGVGAQSYIPWCFSPFFSLT